MKPQGIILSIVSFFLVASTPVNANEYTVTPRVWFSSYTISEQENDSAAVCNDLQMLLYGMTVAMKPDIFRSTDVLLSLYGGSGDAQALEADPPWSTEQRQDLDRVDIELFVRHHIGSEKIWYFGWGGRYIMVDSTRDTSMGDEEYYSDEAAEPYLWKSEQRILLGEVGIGFSKAISDNAEHILFGNCLAGFGREESKFKNPHSSYSGSTSDTETIFSADINIGYMYQFSKQFSGNIRWRNFIIKSDIREVDIWGPEIGIAIHF
ncbi:MAG: hypothetical protein ACOZF0_14600 [Thermodesulfobacteriota bacterium]